MAEKTYKIPINYRSREGKEEQTVVVFNLPIKSGDRSLAVQMVKYFLGIGDLNTTNSEYDAITENAVVGFQEDNRARIYEVGEYGMSSDSLVDLVNTTDGGTDADAGIAEELLGGASINVDLPGGFMTERGQIGEATYRVMIELGLKVAITELASSAPFQGLLLSGPNVNPNSAFRTVTGEQQTPTFSPDGKFVEYNYLTDITRKTITSQRYTDALTYMYENPDILHRLFRDAVTAVFEYYGKEKVWVIDAAERTFIPIVSPLQDAIDDPDLPRKLYENILIHQRKVEEGFAKNQQFKFTINSMTLDEQLNGDKVDVLFGQSLQVGVSPKFACIADLIEPTARPNSPYTMKINIRRDMFNQIRGGSGAADFGGTVDVTDPNNWRKAKAGYDAAKNFVENDLNKPFTADFWKRQGSGIKSGAKKWASGKAMEAESAAKDSLRNSWNKAKSGQSGATQAERDQQTEDAINATSKMENNLTSPATYDLSSMRANLTELSEGVLDFSQDMKKFEEENKPEPRNKKPHNRFNNNPPKPPILPPIDPKLESKRLSNLLTLLEGFLDKNGYTTKVGPKSKDQIQVYFDEVREQVQQPVPVDSSLEPSIDTPQQKSMTEMVEKVVGHKIYKIVYIDNTTSDGKRKELSTGTNDFTTKSPFIFPSTVSYFFALSKNSAESKTPEIIRYINPNACDESQKIPAPIFFSRFHYPSPKFTFRKGKKKGINIGVDFDKRGIKAVREHIDEQLLLAGKSMDNLFESTFFEQKGKVIQTSDVYPKFGEIACNIEDMWKDFLNKWDPQLILCDYKKCVPGLEDLEFDLKFKWDIPTLPKLPTFNPMDFVLPQLKIALADMIMSFVCEMIKNILESISYPDCVDALQYGAALFSELNEKNKENPFSNAQQKADLATKTSQVLNNLGIPQEVLFGESDSSIDTLLDSISLVLRPAELCDLLEGNASDGVLRVVLNVVKSSNSKLKTQLQTLAQIAEFFRVLGQVVDPYLCDRLREISEIVIADALCADRSGMDGLRKRLEEAGISSAEIAKEMASARKRRDALRKIAEDGNFDSLLPGNLPSELAAKQLPGPYSNPHHDRVAKVGLKSILSNVKRIFGLEISSFPDSMIDTNQELIGPGQSGFNNLDYLYFKHYSTQVENLGNGLPAKKAGKIKKPSALEYLAFHTYMMSIGVGTEDYRYIEYYFDPDTEEVLLDLSEDDPDAEKAEQLARLIETHVSGYIEKYSTEKPEVFSELRDIVSQDITSITRKTTTTLGSPYRELHVRVLTEQSEFQPENIDSKSNTPSRISVGYSDMPFIPTQVKDCYRVSYAVHYASNNFDTSYFNKVYKDNLPPEYAAARKDSPDLKSDIHIDKLLRPGGFADLYVEGLKKVSDNKSQENIDAYESSSIRNHISGFIKGSGGLKLDANDDGELTGEERLIYLLNLIAQTAETRQDGFSIYEGFSDSFNFHISDLIKNSKYFSYEEMSRLQQDISQEHIVKTSLEGTPCYVSNPKLLDFDLIVEEFLNAYKQETEKPENDPQFRDFKEPGPFQTSTASGLFGLYVKFSCLEVVLKSMFLFSNFGPKGVFDTQFMIDYLVNYVKSDIDKTLVSNKLRKRIMKMVKSITKIDDEDKALTTLIRKNVDTSSIETLIVKMFEGKYRSFGERVRNEIVENAKEVPNIDNYPKVIIQEDATSSDRAEDIATLDALAELQTRQEDLSWITEQGALEQRIEALRTAAENSTMPFVAQSLNARADQLENSVLFATPESRLQALIQDQRRATELINDLSGYQQMPVSAVIPNIYEKFAFEGYSEELIQKKINSGHFWMEKFYRIGNFPEFFRIYNELYSAVSSDALFQRLPNIGASPGSSLYSEYISPTDLERLLFGTEDSNSRLEMLSAISANIRRNELEYDFVKSFYLKMMNNFFAQRPPSDVRESNDGARIFWTKWRFRNAVVMKMLVDLGFAAKIPEGVENRGASTQSGGDYLEFMPYLRGYGMDYDNERRLSDSETIQPTNTVLTELDYAYRSGQVSKAELIERMLYIIDDVNTMGPNGRFAGHRVMDRSWENNTSPVTVMGASDQERFRNNFGTLNAYKFLGREFVFEQEQYSDNPGYQYRDISRRRKAELIVECLTNMMEIINNWPTNNDAVKDYKTRVCWRDDPRSPEGSGYYNNAKDIFERLSTADRSIDYNTPWYLAYRNDGYDAMVIDSRFTAGGMLAGYPHNSPWYKESAVMQNVVLDYYISRTYAPILDESQLSATRSTSGALSIMKPIEWAAIDAGLDTEIPVNDLYTSTIVPKQKELYDFLKNNLKVGGRLMMGQKVQREYERPAAPVGPGSTELTSIGMMETKPSDIFQDFSPKLDASYDSSRTGNRVVGLFGDPSIFNRKKCFLAYADKYPLNNPDNPTSLDYRSSFYDAASIQVSYFGLGSAKTENRIFQPLYDAKIKNSLVYSIPIHEHIEKVECLDDLYASDNLKPFFPLEKEDNRSDGETPSQTEFLELQSRRDMIRTGIYDLYEDKIVRKLLSLGEVGQSQQSREVDETDPMHPVNIIFNTLFPLKRYVGIHALQNSIVFDKFRQEDGLLSATKLTCLASMDSVATAHDITMDADPQLDVEETQVEMSGMDLGDLWVMFRKALQKLLEQSYARLVRTVGEKADPGYRDMRKGYMSNPCDMKSGLRGSLLGGPLLFDDYQGNLENGFGLVDGKKQYVSINMLPIDVLASAFSPSGFMKVSRHLSGIIQGSSRRYGYPIGPFGALALSSPQLISEQLSNMKEEKQCKDPSAKEPEGICEDEGGEETE
jgi:hypothetical protein